MTQLLFCCFLFDSYYRDLKTLSLHDDKDGLASRDRETSGFFRGGLMKIYLDDERTPPEGWLLVRWPEDAIEYLKTGEVEELSLDHDLGDDERGTGYDVILWVEKAVVIQGFRPPRMKVHSANSSARVKMELGIEAIRKLSARCKADALLQLADLLYFYSIFYTLHQPDVSVGIVFYFAARQALPARRMV